MNKLTILRQQCSLLIKASVVLRQISSLVREGDYAEAEELRNYYKSELEPLLSAMSRASRNDPIVLPGV